MSSLTDIALVAQVVTVGSQRAFASLVERHQEPVRRFLRGLTHGDEALADDLAQETFIRAWQGLSGFRQLSGFETWLLRIAYRVFLDDERALNHSPLAHDGADLSTLDSGAAAASSPSRESSTAGLSMDLDQALSTLSETERTCVVLQCVEGQSIKEIAQIMGIPENTVKSHLLRGKKNLANYLRKNGYNG